MTRIATLALTLALSAPVLAQQAGAGQMAQGAAGARQGQPAYTAPKNDAVPPADPYVADVLKTSPRHGEWVDIKTGSGATVKAWIEYPAASGKVGVVIVIHEIFGLTDWVRGVADQVAKEGFIAIAPDLISGMGPNGGGSAELGTQGSGQVIRNLTNDERAARLDAVMAYGKTIPSSNGKTGVVGFCWGGGSSLSYAISQPGLNAAVMYYGPAPTLPNSATPDLSGLPQSRRADPRALPEHGQSDALDGAADQRRDEEARQELRVPRLRERDTRLHASAQRSRLQGHGRVVAADYPVLQQEPEVIASKEEGRGQKSEGRRKK